MQTTSQCLQFRRISKVLFWDIVPLYWNWMQGLSPDATYLISKKCTGYVQFDDILKTAAKDIGGPKKTIYPMTITRLNENHVGTK